MQVSGLSSVTGISAGNNHAIALSGGMIWTWGGNGNGQLDNGTIIPGTDSNTPAQVSGVSSVTAFAEGQGDTIAL